MGLIKIRLPISQPVHRPFSEALRARIRAALDAGAKPLAPSARRGEWRDYAVLLDPDLVARMLVAFPSQGAQSLGKLAAALVWGHANQLSTPTPPAPAHARSGGATPAWGRDVQRRYYEAIHHALRSANPIVLAEGATGIGKGRVLAQIAREHAADGAVVAAPTIEVLNTNLREWYAHVGHDSGIAVAIALGRDQFVSARRLDDWLSESDPDPDVARRIRSWIQTGAGRSCEHTVPCHYASQGLSWLAEDLLGAAPEVPLDAVRLSTEDDEGDAGACAYARQRSHVSQTARVVYCTHAAVIWDAILRHRGNIGLLPPHATLILDEAHTFESALGLAFSRSLALKRLSREVSMGCGGLISQRRARDAHKALERLIARLLEEPHAAVTALTTERVQSLRPWLADLKQILEGLAKKLPKTTTHSDLAEGIALITDLLAGRAEGTLQLSPVRRYPTLTSGPRGYKFFLEPFWASLPRVVLVSATLYVPRITGELSSGLMRTTLHLPDVRLQTPRPVVPNWLYAPQLLIPAQEASQSLRPPQESEAEDSESHEAALRSWYGAVARWVLWVHQSAGGGMLVLLPGYEAIEGIAEQLETHIACGLVVQRRSQFRVCRRAYVDAYAQGVRPVWLATGPAWTGLDLNGAHLLEQRPNPAQDLLLTDLVIPRIPFGTAHSAAHRVRSQALVTAERDRAAFQLRQGLGRIMRREGLLRRRIWLLDTRIWDPRKTWLFAPMRAILSKYQMLRIDPGAQSPSHAGFE